MRQFYGHLEKCVLSAGKTMSVKFPFFGGGGFGGGGECRFYFYGRADFSEIGLRNMTTIANARKLHLVIWLEGNHTQVA